MISVSCGWFCSSLCEGSISGSLCPLSAEACGTQHSSCAPLQAGNENNNKANYKNLLLELSAKKQFLLMGKRGGGGGGYYH